MAEDEPIRQLAPEQVDACVRSAISGFIEFVARTRWLGRENEAVNQFVLGFFMPHALKAGMITDPTQLGIEVAVPQFGSGKMQARKDLVVWARPGMTCFDEDWKPTRFPVAVLEWKWQRNRGSPETLVNFPYDLAWLQRFTEGHPERVGYAVAGLSTRQHVGVTVSRVFAGAVTPKWLALGEAVR